MVNREFLFAESLKSKGVTNLFLKDNEIIVEINDNPIKTMLDDDSMTTINNVRNNLDKFTNNSKIKEEIILTISKNLEQIFGLENGREKSNGTICEVNMTFDEWKTTLLQHYFELKKAAEKNFPNLWESLEFELAVKNILHINNCTLRLPE